MKALVKSKAEPGLWMQDVPMPKVGDNDLLIRVKKTAICGTDVHIWKWDAWSQRTVAIGQTVGHEFVGEIVEMGRSVSGYKIGKSIGRRAYRLRSVQGPAGRANVTSARTRWGSA